LNATPGWTDRAGPDFRQYHNTGAKYQHTYSYP